MVPVWRTDREYINRWMMKQVFERIIRGGAKFSCQLIGTIFLWITYGNQFSLLQHLFGMKPCYVSATDNGECIHSIKNNQFKTKSPAIMQGFYSCCFLINWGCPCLYCYLLLCFCV